MSIQHHPKRGTILEVDFDTGFRPPEMVKKRLCVVVSPPIEGRGDICTVIPLSTSPPKNPAAYHYELFIPFALPDKWKKKSVGQSAIW